MTVGIGIFLIVVGAVLAFAVTAEVDFVDLDLVGWILMGAGVVVVLVALIVMIPRSRRIRTTAVTTDAAGQQYVTERENRVDGL